MKAFRDTKYHITEDGKIYNSNTRKYLSPQVKYEPRSTFQRMYVGLYINGKQKFFTVARMVAELYVPNPNKYLQVNHIDGNPLNNSVNNLEWVTQSQNIRHAINVGLKNMKGINNTSAKLSPTMVEQAKLDYNTHQYSLRQLASKYNVSYTAIRYAIKEKTWI